VIRGLLAMVLIVFLSGPSHGWVGSPPAPRDAVIHSVGAASPRSGGGSGATIHPSNSRNLFP
jgi:hypothetical protein